MGAGIAPAPFVLCGHLLSLKILWECLSNVRFCLCFQASMPCITGYTTLRRANRQALDLCWYALAGDIYQLFASTMLKCCRDRTVPPCVVGCLARPVRDKGCANDTEFLADDIVRQRNVPMNTFLSWVDAFV